MRRLLQGEEAAYADLCGLYGAALHRYAASHLRGDRELAEEVVAAALADVVRNIRRFSPHRASLSAWIYGIARRHVQAEGRRQQRKRSVPAEAQVPLEAVAEFAEQEGMEAAAQARIDAQRQVARLSVILSEEELEALLLFHGEGFSAPEIARIVGRSERAVETILYRARQKARACLGAADG